MTIQRLQLKLTEELIACLKRADENRKDGAIGVGPLIEELLRKLPVIKTAQTALGIEFTERPRVGKPKKAT